MNEFIGFPKMARLNREIVITEKIDGTNGQIRIEDDGVTMLVGSRTRWITPQNDNFGFAAWVEANRDELRKLGPGSHFGEWWGAGIQRRYGMIEKVFSLFNVTRWHNAADLPHCCRVVPVIYRGAYTPGAAETSLAILRTMGSQAAPGFMDPEGIVIYHTAAKTMFKVTLENDDLPKSQV